MHSTHALRKIVKINAHHLRSSALRAIKNTNGVQN